MRLLSTADVLEVTGLTSKELRSWCEKEIIKPVAGGNGHGSHRRFTKTQTVGIALGSKLRRGSLGIVLSGVALVVERIGSMTESELLAEFEKGNTHIVPVSSLPLRPAQGYDDDDDRDVRETYEQVTEGIAQIEERLRYHVGGRTRGLAGASKATV